MKTDLEGVTIVAETKTREGVALMNERECLVKKLENAELDIRKLRSRVRTETRPQRRSSSGGWRRSTRRARSVDLQIFMRFYSCNSGHNQHYPETFQNVVNALSSGQER